MPPKKASTKKVKKSNMVADAGITKSSTKKKIDSTTGQQRLTSRQKKLQKRLDDLKSKQASEEEMRGLQDELKALEDVNDVEMTEPNPEEEESEEKTEEEEEGNAEEEGERNAEEEREVEGKRTKQVKKEEVDPGKGQLFVPMNDNKEIFRSIEFDAGEGEKTRRKETTRPHDGATQKQIEESRHPVHGIALGLTPPEENSEGEVMAWTGFRGGRYVLKISEQCYRLRKDPPEGYKKDFKHNISENERGSRRKEGRYEKFMGCYGVAWESGEVKDLRPYEEKDYKPPMVYVKMKWADDVFTWEPRTSIRLRFKNTAAQIRARINNPNFHADRYIMLCAEFQEKAAGNITSAEHEKILERAGRASTPKYKRRAESREPELPDWDTASDSSSGSSVSDWLSDGGAYSTDASSIYPTRPVRKSNSSREKRMKAILKENSNRVPRDLFRVLMRC